MLRLSSSIRVEVPERTLIRAKAMAARLAISRVTDITRLDKIGIPVFASVRPGAMEGSLCVNAGKGARPIEAEIGAYMEAIEFAVAEPIRSRHRIVAARSADLLGGNKPSEVLGDFCPMPGQGVSLAGPIDCVAAEDLVSETQVLVPAELVFLPYEPRHGMALFGSSSNGLASGNSLSEATLHALLEVMERDIASLNYVRNTSRRILEEGLPDVVLQQIELVRSAGLLLCLRAMPNEFAVPMVGAHLFDPASIGPVALASGFGCHLLPEIAVVRAITEAVQSRLSAIHGGRDDLDRTTRRLAQFQAGELERRAASEFQSLLAWPDTVTYTELEAGTAEATSVDAALTNLIDRLLASGIHHVCRVVLTEPTEQLHVVRVVVPRLEHFERHFRRVGPRLLAHMHGSLA